MIDYSKCVETLCEFFDELTADLNVDAVFDVDKHQGNIELSTAMHMAHNFLHENSYKDVLGYVAEDLVTPRLNGSYAPTVSEVQEDIDFFLAMVSEPIYREYVA